MVLFMLQFVFLKKKQRENEHKIFFFFVFYVCFLMQIWYGWKDFVETFLMHTFFFFVIFEVTVEL